MVIIFETEDKNERYCSFNSCCVLLHFKLGRSVILAVRHPNTGRIYRKESAQLPRRIHRCFKATSGLF